MTDDRPQQVGWLHYRLAVAFCAAVAMSITMLAIAFLVLIIGPTPPGAWNLFPHIFSKWGAAIVVASAAFGFAAGSARTANFFSVLWGTHPFWSELAGWLQEHENVAVSLGWALVVLVVGSFWYAFR